MSVLAKSSPSNATAFPVFWLLYAARTIFIALMPS